MSSAEPARSRWARRARTIPLVLGATVLLLVTLPVWFPAVVVADVVRGRTRLPLARVGIFALQYAVNDSVEILAAPLLWMWAGFGRHLDTDASIDRHGRLQAWSIGVLGRRAEHELGLRVELDAASAAALGDGPVIVLCRHVNIVDASLPSMLYGHRGVPTRGVIMAEMLADPGFDLIYGRAGSVFIPRADGAGALELMTAFGRHAARQDAVVIFPEGRLFRPDASERAIARLRDSSPERAERFAGARHVLPPRPGGVQALLAGLPDRDVVVIAHTGLDAFPTFAALARAVPLAEPVRVTAWRIPRAEIPAEPDAQTEWLDRQWLRVEHLAAQAAARS